MGRYTRASPEARPQGSIAARTSAGGHALNRSSPKLAAAALVVLASFGAARAQTVPATLGAPGGMDPTQTVTPPRETGGGPYGVPGLRNVAGIETRGRLPGEFLDAYATARANVAGARWTYIGALLRFDNAVYAKYAQFEVSAEHRAAQDKLDAALAKYEAARGRALGPLNQDDRYVGVEDLHRALGNRLQTVAENGGPGGDPARTEAQVRALSQLRLEARLQNAERERDALRDNAEVDQARQEVRQAGVELRRLREDFALKTRLDEALLAQRREVDDLRAAKVAASAYYNAAKDNRIDAVRYNRRALSDGDFGVHDGYGYGDYYGGFGYRRGIGIGVGVGSGVIYE